MKLNVIKMVVHRRKFLPDLVIIEVEVPGMGKTTKMELELEEGEGLRYLQEHFSQGELYSYDLSIKPLKSQEVGI